MQGRWLISIPDTLPERDPDTDIGTWAEVERLHSQLKMTVETVTRRQQEAVEKYGVVLDPSNELRARFNLLTDMFIGITSPERLRFEINWQKIIAESIEEGIALAQERKREQKLHLPNGRSHTVRPAISEAGEDSTDE